MKKLTLFFATIVAILSLAACTPSEAKDTSKNEQNTAQSSKDKADREAKAKEKENQEKVAKLIASATENPSSSAIKSAKDSNAELTDENIKSENSSTIKKLEDRLKLIDIAEKAVKAYQNHAMDHDYQRKADIAIKAIKDKNDNDVKTKLLKSYNTSVQQAKAAIAAEKAHQEQLIAEQQAREKAAQEEAARVQAEREAKAAAEQAQKEQQAEASASGYSTDTSGWGVAQPGYCFYRPDSKRYYSSVKNPGNYIYMPVSEAQSNGGSPGHSNGSAHT